MNNPEDDRGILKTKPHGRNLAAIMLWLTEPLKSLPEPVRRRSRLLAWLLLTLFALILAVLVLLLIVNTANIPKRNAYIGLIFSIGVLVALAFFTNRSGNYILSAVLTIICAVIGPWGSMIVDPAILRGDFVPLTYVVIPILLSSILLPTYMTIIVAVIQLIALSFVPVFSTATTSINWSSFIAFIIFGSVLSILANVIRERDLVQIDRQTSLLLQSEAQLRDLSIRDHLTTLFNRRYLDETLEREIQRATRRQVQLGIIMLDIDHFKRVNDKLGHAAGDMVLMELGKLLNKNIRLDDIACRFGGEEFVLVLPETSLDVTRERAERLRKEVKQLRLEYQHHSLENITVSLGVAVFPDHGSTGEAVLKSADAALYRAKHEGRDRVVVAD